MVHFLSFHSIINDSLVLNNPIFALASRLLVSFPLLLRVLYPSFSSRRLRRFDRKSSFFDIDLSLLKFLLWRSGPKRWKLVNALCDYFVVRDEDSQSGLLSLPFPNYRIFIQSSISLTCLRLIWFYNSCHLLLTHTCFVSLFLRHWTYGVVWRTHLGQHFVQPLQRTVQMDFYPTWRWSYILAMVLSSPSFYEWHPKRKINYCYYCFYSLCCHNCRDFIVVAIE